VRVAARTGGATVGVDLVHEPQRDAGRRTRQAQPPRHRLPRLLVAVDAADDEHTMCCGAVADDERADRPAAHRVAHLDGVVRRGEASAEHKRRQQSSRRRGHHDRVDRVGTSVPDEQYTLELQHQTLARVDRVDPIARPRVAPHLVA
jgi:hypothetical protein